MKCSYEQKGDGQKAVTGSEDAFPVPVRRRRSFLAVDLQRPCSIGHQPQLCTLFNNLFAITTSIRSSGDRQKPGPHTLNGYFHLVSGQAVST